MLAAALLTILAQPPTTGRSGMDDLLAAADAANTPAMKAILAYEAAVLRPDGGSLPPRPPGLPEKPTPLDFAQAKVASGQRALSLLRRANDQPFDRSTLINANPIERFPILAKIRVLSRLAADAAYVEFARGNGALGADWLLEGLTLGEHLSGTTVIGELVAGSNSAIFFREIDDHRRSIPLDRWDDLQRWAEGRLADRASLKSLFVHEALATRRLMESAFAEDAKGGSKPADPDANLDEFDRRLARIKPASYPTVLRAMDDEFARRIREIGRILDLPESQWTQAAKADPEPGTKGADSWTDAQVGAYLAGLTMSTGGEALEVLARRRTQMRLLVITAWIETQRWRDGRVPTSLAGLGSAWEFDPYSDQPWVYRVEEGDYVLNTVAVGGQGEISLRSGRSTPAEGADGERQP